jgi:hypothetical protein
VATLAVDLPGFEPQNGRQLSSEWLVSGRVARKRAMSGRAVVHVHMLTGTHAPGALWSDTMSGQKGVRPNRVCHHLRRPHVGCDRGDRALRLRY